MNVRFNGKFSAVIVMVAAMFFIVATAVTHFQDERSRCDVNEDGIINILDLQLVAKYFGERVGLEHHSPDQTDTQILDDTMSVPTPEGMVLIPAGEFQMGSNDTEADNDERPVRTVYVDAFYMDKTEVTNAEYQKFVLENPFWQKGLLNIRFHNGAYLSHWDGNNYPSGKGDHPVTRVSWYAAVAYAQWAGKRLPTEAEWERAARGGLIGKKYPHGNTLTPADANYREDTRGKTRGTTPVETYPPNAYGLYDMAGNVWEWCLDKYDAEFYASFPSDLTVQNPFSGENSVDWIIKNFVDVFGPRVWRGGSWLNPASLARVSHRGWMAPSLPITGGFSGFRCVKDLPR